MPSLPKTNPALARKRLNRKPVQRVRKPGLPVPSVRENAGRRNRTARPPVTPDGLILDGETSTSSEATGQEIGRPADRLISEETIAAAAALDSPAGLAANGTVNAQGTPLAGDAKDGTIAPPAGEPDLKSCTADAAELIEFAWSTVTAADIGIPKRTRAALEKKETRDGIASATGRLFMHYGITGVDIISNPWAGLALALSPVAMAMFMDWREASAKDTATTTPAPVPKATPVGKLSEAGATPSPLSLNA
jgi:hypothetical protein